MSTNTGQESGGLGARRNATYRQLRAPARQGAYTIAQLIALAAAGLAAVVLGALLVELGAPVALALIAGVLVAGAPATVAMAIEGREFNVPGLIRALVAWQRSPRRYAAGASDPGERHGRTPWPNRKGRS